MNDRVPKERLGASSLNHVFLKIYPYDPPSPLKISGIRNWLMQSKIKICKAHFSQTKKL